MKTKVYYETPVLNEVEFNQEGILCASERQGGIDQLQETHDWSGMWNN